MRQVLDKFVATDGVQGAYIIHPEDGVFESKMPSRFKEDVLNEIGSDLAGLSDLARSDFSDPKEITFLFEDAAFRVRDAKKGYRFIALCSPDMDGDVLLKASDVFIDEFDQAIANPPKLSVVKGGQGSSDDALTPEGLMRSKTLAGPLGTMQSSLAKVIGPMARIIFSDALEQWLTLDTPCMDSLPVLTDIVLEEIGDGGLASSFKERLPSFCSNSSSDSLTEKREKKKSDMKVVQSM